MLPLFPAPNPGRVNFEILGELSVGDDEGFGVDAIAQDVHGCCGVGAVWFELSILESPLPSRPLSKGREQENFDFPENIKVSLIFPP